MEGIIPGAEVPPVATVYHLKVNPEVPVATRYDAVLFSQRLSGVVTVGTEGAAFTVTAIAVAGLSQPSGTVTCVT